MYACGVCPESCVNVYQCTGTPHSRVEVTLLPCQHSCRRATNGHRRAHAHATAKARAKQLDVGNRCMAERHIRGPGSKHAWTRVGSVRAKHLHDEDLQEKLECANDDKIVVVHDAGAHTLLPMQLARIDLVEDLPHGSNKVWILAVSAPLAPRVLRRRGNARHAHMPGVDKT